MSLDGESALALPALTDGVAWSVRVCDADTDRVLAEHQPEEVLRTASVGKVLLLLEVAHQLELGRLDPAQPLGWHNDEHLADSGLWYLLRRRELPLEYLCWLVGAMSDNLATNVLLRRVGLDAVAETADALGLRHTALLDRVRTDRGPTHPPTLSRGNAAELAAVMARLHRGEAAAPAACRRVLRWLAAGADLSMVGAACGLDPLAHAEPDRGLLLVNKTGTISVVRADVGLLTGPAGTLAYAVLAEWPDDASAPDPRDDVLAAMREIGAGLRAAVSGVSRRP